MRIGSRSSDYRHQIIIENKTTTKDATGAAVPTWATKYKLMAEIYNVKGSEFQSDDKLLSQGLFRIGVRYRPGIDQTMRVKLGTRIFEILHVNNIEERNVKLVLTCKEDE